MRTLPPKIGNLRRTFQPSAANLGAGVIIALLLIGGGCTSGYLATKAVIDSRGQLPFGGPGPGWCWVAVAIWGLLAIGLVIGGVCLIRWLWSLSSLHVYLGDDGFAASRRNELQILRWDHIVSVKETHLYERPPILEKPARFLLPKMKSKSYIVRREDGEEFGFDGNSISGHEEFAAMIKTQIDRRGIPWEIVEQHA